MRGITQEDTVIHASMQLVTVVSTSVWISWIIRFQTLLFYRSDMIAVQATQSNYATRTFGQCIITAKEMNYHSSYSEQGKIMSFWMRGEKEVEYTQEIYFFFFWTFQGRKGTEICKSEKTNCLSLQFALKYLKIGKINQNIQKPEAAGEPSSSGWMLEGCSTTEHFPIVYLAVTSQFGSWYQTTTTTRLRDSALTTNFTNGYSPSHRDLLPLHHRKPTLLYSLVLVLHHKPNITFFNFTNLVCLFLKGTWLPSTHTLFFGVWYSRGHDSDLNFFGKGQIFQHEVRENPAMLNNIPGMQSRRYI